MKKNKEYLDELQELIDGSEAMANEIMNVIFDGESKIDATRFFLGLEAVRMCLHKMLDTICENVVEDDKGSDVKMKVKAIQEDYRQLLKDALKASFKIRVIKGVT